MGRLDDADFALRKAFGIIEKCRNPYCRIDYFELCTLYGLINFRQAEIYQIKGDLDMANKGYMSALEWFNQNDCNSTEEKEYIYDLDSYAYTYEAKLQMLKNARKQRMIEIENDINLAKKLLSQLS